MEFASADQGERDAAGTALRESEERYRKLFELSHDAIFLLDPERNRVLEVNRAGVAMFGYDSREELLATPLSEFHPEDIDEFLNFVRGVQEEGSGWTDEFACRAKDGRFLTSEISASSIVIDGRPCLLAAVRDASERKRAEEALRESHNRRRELLESLPVAIYTTDAEGRITYFNEAAVQLAGRRPELDSDKWCVSWKLYRPDGTPLPHDRCPMAVAIRENWAVTGEEIIAERPDGSRATVIPFPVPVRDSSGALVGAVNTLVDITDRKRAEEALRASDAFNQRVLASSTDCIKVLDLDGNLLSMSEGGQRGLAIDDVTPLIGKSWTAFFGAADRQRASDAIAKAASGEAAQFVGMVAKTTGEPRWWSSVVTPVPATDGRPERLLVISRDISEAKRQQQVFFELIERCPFGIYIVDSEFRIASMNQRSQDGAFVNVRPVIGRDFGEAMGILWPEDVAQEIIGHFRRTLETGEPFHSRDFVRPRSDIPQVEGYEWELHRILLPDGSFGVVCYYYDSTELRDAQRRVRLVDEIVKSIASESEVERMVQVVTDAATELSGARFGSFFYNVLDEQGERYLLYTLSGAPREAFEKFGLPRNTPVFDHTFRGLGAVRSDDIRKDPRYGTMAPHHGMPKGHLPVVSYLAVPVVLRSGEVIGGLFFGHEQPGVFNKESEEVVTSIAAHAAIALDNARTLQEVRCEAEQRKRAESHQRLLIDELNHRVKNTLAIVQALAQQSFQPDSSPAAAREAFEGRLEALAGAHNVLTREQWKSADLKDIARGALKACGVLDRASVKGPSVQFGPRVAVTLAMALHELCTNALKYGALSVENGRVSIAWAISGEREPRLHFRWKERGGPPVSEPRRRGFGSRLIERVLASDLKGTTRLEYPSEGILFELDAPLPCNRTDEAEFEDA